MDYNIDWKRAGRLMKAQMILDGITAQDLAERLGVTEATVNNYLRGDKNIAPERMCTICDVFGWSLDYFVGREFPICES